MALPFLLLRIGRPGVAAGVRSLFAFWAGGGAAAETEVVEPPVSVGGGYWRPQRPFAIDGVGYAILPELEGEAHGFVVAIGAGAATLRAIGTAVGTVGVAGRSAARLSIRAAALGGHGLAGSGAGVVTLKGAAIGRHDDDEVAMIALLLLAA